MKNNYKQFKFRLLTQAPVHIGSGEKYTSREFIYKKQEGLYYFPDMGRFYNEMINLGQAQKFEAFLLDSRNQTKRLNDFIDEIQLKNLNFGGYIIKETGLEKSSDTRGQLNEILKFVRDAYGQPYIPGSSLKGAIRTILMTTNWKEVNFVETRGNKQFENKRAIPWGSKPKFQTFDDIFNEIRVSDSHPLANEDLIIVQKWDHSVSRQESKALPLYREAIAPLKYVEFTITTTTPRAEELIVELGKFAKEHYQQYKQFFLQYRTKNGHVLDSGYIQNNLQSPIYLGAGSGVWTKTVMQQANTIVKRRYQRGHTIMRERGAVKLTKAPNKKYKSNQQVKTLLTNQENYYEMGKCSFSVREIGDKS